MIRICFVTTLVVYSVPVLRLFLNTPDLIWPSVLGYVCRMIRGVFTLAVQGLFVCIAFLRSAGIQVSRWNQKDCFFSLLTLIQYPGH